MTTVANRRAVVDELASDDFRRQVTGLLPTEIPADRFIAVARAAILRQPDLADTDRASLFDAVKRCAQAGLMPDGYEAAFVVFKGKAQFMPMVAGIRRQAANHGWRIETEVVYSLDRFDYILGVNPQLQHIPPPLGDDRGEIIGAYAVATNRAGEKQIEVMDAAAIEKVRKASRSPNAGPWSDWPERMYEKTVAHRLFRKLPLATLESSVAVAIADEDIMEPERTLSPPARPELVPADAAFTDGDEEATADSTEAER
jgi:recombination protein RecT